MPTSTNIEYPKPRSWEELELLVWDLFRHLWGDPYTTRHGRSGQRQYGVDIYGHPDRGSVIHGVQVKGKNGGYGREVSEKELRNEVNKAKSFSPPLGQYVLVTSAPRSSTLQGVARTITDEHHQQALFPVEVWGWEDIEERLGAYPDLLRLHYPQFFTSNTGQDYQVLQELLESNRQEAQFSEDKDRPRFTIGQKGLTAEGHRFAPAFKVQQFGGDAVTYIEWRFRGPRFSMEWQSLAANRFPSQVLKEVYDLSLPPGEDDLVNVDELGLEVRVNWRGKWRHEVHRWPIWFDDVMRKPQWKIKREVPRPIEFDSDNEPSDN
ncbi:MAG: hypothetical protein IH861_11865 [Chloroflexi bacterium]|nr:hypothetical protein [Chloroflexota bacterium]